MSNAVLSKTDSSPVVSEVHDAARRIRGMAVVTPLVRNDTLDTITGTRSFLKAECLQRTGSFKFRGAFNALSMLSDEQREKGVVATSSGNHAQGVAEAARLLNIKATIVMPTDAPALKIARTRRSGAEIVLYERDKQSRDAIAQEIGNRTGATFIHPYNYRNVIAGQGTCGLEIVDQMELGGAKPDRVLVCTGGGGLTAGVALAIHERFADARIHTVEPEGFDDYRRSLEAGKILSNEHPSGSACDALMSPSAGELGFAINRDHIASGLVVSDKEAFEAMRFAFLELKLVLEPGGAVALAALIGSGKTWAGETIACVLSGGNVDADLFASILRKEF